MASFFDKLKKGMGVEEVMEEEEVEEEVEEEKPVKEIKKEKKRKVKAKVFKSPVKKKVKKITLQRDPEDEESESVEVETEVEEEPTTIEDLAKTTKKKKKKEIEEIEEIEEETENEEEEMEEEEKPRKDKKGGQEDSDLAEEKEVGQLAIDLYQTADDLVIQSAIAGVKPEALNVAIERDVVTIKGVRQKPENEEEKGYLYQECYWGPFSREIILPEEVDPSRIEAEMKEGILTIRIPKIQKQRKRQITIKKL